MGDLWWEGLGLVLGLGIREAIVRVRSGRFLFRSFFVGSWGFY